MAKPPPFAPFELIVVIAIIAILAAEIPNFMGIQDRVFLA
jgi:type II secretory pathway pseudopilin PulG